MTFELHKAVIVMPDRCLPFGGNGVVPNRGTRTLAGRFQDERSSLVFGIPEPAHSVVGLVCRQMTSSQETPTTLTKVFA
jgi:hypothetical protein